MRYHPLPSCYPTTLPPILMNPAIQIYIYNNMRAEKGIDGVNTRGGHSRRIISRISRAVIGENSAENGSCRRIFPLSPEPGNPATFLFPRRERQESSYLYIVLRRARTFATALYGRFLRPYASRFSERPVSRRFTARIRRELHFCSFVEPREPRPELISSLARHGCRLGVSWGFLFAACFWWASSFRWFECEIH